MTTTQATRREFLRTAGLGTVALGAMSAPGLCRTARATEDRAKTKILLIGHKPDHPPGTHLYLHECGLLAKCLEQTAGVKAVVSDGWPTDPKVLEGVKAIALYSSPGAEILLKGPHARQVEDLLNNGVGLTALHWATGVLNKDDKQLADRYLSQLGGLFSFAFSGLAIIPGKVEQPAPEHPICRGWSDYQLKMEEFYLDLKFLPEAKPVMTVSVQGKDQVVGWVYERAGGGRSYGNTLGHFHECFTTEPFRRAIVNGILWTAHHEIPQSGAPCTLSDEELKLPA